jgi:hypothetical protein
MNTFAHRVFPRIGRQPSFSCALRKAVVCSDCLFLRFISRQFIARYVHDLIVKHNVRDIPDYPDLGADFYLSHS